MEIVKKTDNYVILKKRSGRYGVRSRSRHWIRGEEKQKILVDAGLAAKNASKSSDEGSDSKAKSDSNQESNVEA
jgi:hypothetical protein